MRGARAPRICYQQTIKEITYEQPLFHPSLYRCWYCHNSGVRAIIGYAVCGSQGYGTEEGGHEKQKYYERT